jgi:N-acetylmuramic acid 6-phosphate etherase
MEKRVTESDSNYDNLERMSVSELLTNINREDKTVAFAIEKALNQIEKLIDTVVSILYRSWNQRKIRNC